MALETGTYISDLVSTNPTASDPKSQGDDHIRLLKATIKASFTGVTGAVTATHTEMNYLVGVSSGLQAQLNLKAPLASPTFTGTPAAPTAAGGTSTTQIATTAFVATSFAPLASPALTGTPTAPTAAGGTNTTQLATTAFVQQQAFSAALPVQSGNAGKVLTTDGSNASWSLNPSLPDVIVQQQGGSTDSLTAATWNTRTLNTVVRNNSTIATVGSNQITLPAGTYYIRVRSAAGGISTGSPYTAQYVSRVYNVTAGAVAFAQGEAIQAGQNSVGDGIGGITQVSGVVTLGGSSALRIDTYAHGGVGSGGYPTSSGGTEVYSTVEIWKVS